MNTSTTSAAASYLTQVKEELADLPDAELDDVLEDVADHLEQVSSELPDEATMAALTARLGTPRQYADELRTAAGYPPRRTPGRKDPARRALFWGIVGTVLLPVVVVSWLMLGMYWSFAALLVWTLIALVPIGLGIRALHGQDPRIVTETELWRRGADWLSRRADRLPDGLRRDLVTVGQPAWWVFRGAIGGLLLSRVFGGLGILELVAVLGGAMVSVWVARRSQRDRRWLWFLVPANVVAVLGLLLLLLSGSFLWRLAGGDYSGPSYDMQNTSWTAGLGSDGQPVENIFLFDQQGKPLTNVRMYDQAGRPLTLPIERCANETGAGLATEPEETNVYPKVTVHQPDWSDCRESLGPTFVVTPLKTPPPGPVTPTPPAR